MGRKNTVHPRRHIKARVGFDASAGLHFVFPSDPAVSSSIFVGEKVGELGSKWSRHERISNTLSLSCSCFTDLSSPVPQTQALEALPEDCEQQAEYTQVELDGQAGQTASGGAAGEQQGTETFASTLPIHTAAQEGRTERLKMLVRTQYCVIGQLIESHF